MTKSFQKIKEKDRNATGVKFRTPSSFKTSNFAKVSGKNQSFNRRPVNIVRHKV